MEWEAQAGEIRFEHVWFAYKDDDYVIKDLNFTIHPGEKVVGPTGAGKVPSSAFCAASTNPAGVAFL